MTPQRPYERYKIDSRWRVSICDLQQVFMAKKRRVLPLPPLPSLSKENIVQAPNCDLTVIPTTQILNLPTVGTTRLDHLLLTGGVGKQEKVPI